MAFYIIAVEPQTRCAFSIEWLQMNTAVCKIHPYSFLQSNPRAWEVGIVAQQIEQRRVEDLGLE